MEKKELLLRFLLGCGIRSMLLPAALHGEEGREKFMKISGNAGGKAKSASQGSDEQGGGGKVRKNTVSMGKAGEMLLMCGRSDLSYSLHSSVFEDQNDRSNPRGL